MSIKNFALLFFLSAIVSCKKNTLKENSLDAASSEKNNLPAGIINGVEGQQCGVAYCCGYSTNPYNPVPQKVGNGAVMNTTATTASINITGAPYRYGNIVYVLPAGFSYSISFQIRKFGNPLASQFSAGAQTYTATTTWQTYTYQSPDMQGLTATLHSISNSGGSYGGVEIKTLNITRTGCITTCVDPCPCTPGPWETVPLTAALFTNNSTGGTGTVVINSPSSVTFTASANANRLYNINVPAGYQYELTWTMSYTIAYLGGEGGVYPDVNDHEYYTTNNCVPNNPDCQYGKIGEDFLLNNQIIHIYHPAGTMFTNNFTNTILFRTNTTNSPGNMTIYNFSLRRRQCL